MKYLRHFKPAPEFRGYGATVAVGIDIDEATGSRKISLGLALCTPDDQFSRPKGRLIAEGRRRLHEAGVHRPSCPGCMLRRLFGSDRAAALPYAIIEWAATLVEESEPADSDEPDVLVSHE